MRHQKRHYEYFARLLEYPTKEYLNNLSALIAEQSLPESSRLEVGAFALVLEPLALTDIEELYTRTFDINPVASLEVGWHLYGEQYERGRFLVHMRERLATCSIPEGTELPDHIASALRLCAAEDEEAAAEFIGTYLFPAIEKIQTGLVEKENPYRHVVAAMQSALEMHCTHPQGEEHHV